MCTATDAIAFTAHVARRTSLPATRTLHFVPSHCRTLFGLASAMPAEFTQRDVAAIAALAQLELAPAELDVFTRQLGDILTYADQVRQIDTSGVPPTASVLTRHPSDRLDQIRPSLDSATALANAPEAAHAAGLFKVPRVIG